MAFAATEAAALLWLAGSILAGTSQKMATEALTIPFEMLICAAIVVAILIPIGFYGSAVWRRSRR